MSVPSCDRCGSEWIDPATARELDAVGERKGSLLRAMRLSMLGRGYAARGDTKRVSATIRRLDEAYLALGPLEAMAFSLWAQYGTKIPRRGEVMW